MSAKGQSKMCTSLRKISTVKFAAVALLMFAAGCGPSPKTPNQPDQPHFTEIKTRDTYVHVATGMQFPVKLAGFTRGRILQYDAAGDNISAEYTLQSYGFKIAELTVYIYPVETDPRLGPLTLEKHFDEVRSLLFNIYTDAHNLVDGKITIGQPSGPQHGLMFSFEHRPPELFHSKPCYAKLYLFKYGPWFIKYRLTNPIKQDKKVKKQFDLFVQQLTWPTLPAAEVKQSAVITPDSNF
jgi:hypothetical protein